MVAISVIVPVYNVEYYLRKCVDSILCQTFQDFELILIDDGSTDASGDICDEYGRKCDRIHVIHKENEGLSEARNRGIEESKGEYLTFIDSDDYVSRRYLEVLYRLIKRYCADLAICDSIEVWAQKGTRKEADQKRRKRKKEEVISRTETYKRALLNKHMCMAAWAKLYHRRLFQKIRYPKGEIYEDMNIFNQIVENSNKIVCSRYQGYVHLRRKGSLMHERMNSRQMFRIKNAKQLQRFIMKKYPEMKHFARIFYDSNAIQMINLMVLDPKKRYEKECQVLRKEVLKDGIFLFFSRGPSLEEKAALLCLLPGIGIYRFVWHQYLRLTKKDSGTIL